MNPGLGGCIDFMQSVRNIGFRFHEFGAAKRAVIVIPSLTILAIGLSTKGDTAQILHHIQRFFTPVGHSSTTFPPAVRDNPWNTAIVLPSSAVIFTV